MKIELKKVKFHEDMSDETNCFSADIWVDGKKLASVQNQGTGGENMYYPFNGRSDPAWLAFEKHCKSLPPQKCEDASGFKFTINPDMDTVVGDVFSEWVKKDDDKRQKAQIKRWCKTQTVYRLKGDNEGSWRTIKHIWDERVKAHLTKIHGDQLEEIANERK